MMKAIGKVIFNYKAVLIVFSLILMSASSMAVAEHKSNIDQLSMTYSFNQPIITTVEIENTVFDEVIIPGVLSAGNPGEPCLPIKGSYILLPQGKTVEKITIQTPDMITLGCNYYVKPVGDIVPISQKTTVSPPTPDETIYSSDEVYPGTLYNEVDIYSFRGYQILVLELYPVHYIPLSGELLYYEEITIILDLKKDETTHPLYRGLEKDKVEVLTQRRVSDILQEFDMLGIINVRVISKGRGGRMREIKLAISQNILKKAKGIIEESLNYN